MSDYHPNLDGPAEPVGLAMKQSDFPTKSSFAAPAGSARWERSEYPHPKFPPGMKLQLLPNVIWLRIHGNEVTGWQKKDPNEKGQR